MGGGYGNIIERENERGEFLYGAKLGGLGRIIVCKDTLIDCECSDFILKEGKKCKCMNKDYYYSKYYENWTNLETYEAPFWFG